MECSWFLTLLCVSVFFSSSAQNNVCFRPQLPDSVDTEELQRFFSPGAELVLSCKKGYTPISGPRKIVCAASGQWTKTKYSCTPKRCSYPDDLLNGEIDYEDTVYQSTVNYSCHEGFIMTGASSAECLANGTWSAPAPHCTAVTCGLAPIPLYGMIIYDKTIRGNTTDFGVGGTYRCHPPYAVFGEARAECTASGYWTKTPECRVVTCPPPEDIDRGYMSVRDQRDFYFMDTVRYGCSGDDVLEGSLEVVCQQDGTWSEKPSCKTSCSVDIQRAKILYKGRKIWIKDLNPKKILHREMISVFCMDKTRKCGYSVPTQCTDGKLIIPECFEEPRGADYILHSDLLPSEIPEC